MSLSAVIITRDESTRLPACLTSLSFADEIVVVDYGSVDGTPQLAASLGARVTIAPDWPGFGAQKNRAVAQAAGEWILSIDADERVTPSLRDSIVAAIASGSFDCYTLNRRSSYCGQYMLRSGWSPDPVLRLFRRGTASFSQDTLHERLVATGPVGALDGDLLHESFADFEAVLDKVNRYSTASARALHERGERASFGKALGHGLWAFLRTYVLRRGFLDGRLGLALAISNAEGTYYRYLKLWLMHRHRAPAQETAPRS